MAAPYDLENNPLILTISTMHRGGVISEVTAPPLINFHKELVKSCDRQSKGYTSGEYSSFTLSIGTRTGYLRPAEPPL